MRKHLVPHSLPLEVKPTLKSVWEDLYGVESLILGVSGKEYLVGALVSPMDVWEKPMKQRDHWLLVRVKVFSALGHAGRS